MEITAQMVKELRERSGAGILACKEALQEAGGDMEKAMQILKARNQAIATKKSSREAKEGVVASYIHGEGRIGVLVEVNCETDFVARSDVFRSFVHEICLQIAAASPVAISKEDLPQEMVNSQKEVFRLQAMEQKKPPEVIEKIVEGKMNKWYSEVCLLEQPYIWDEKRTVRELLNEVIARTGENVRIRRFVRYEVGESI